MPVGHFIGLNSIGKTKMKISIIFLIVLLLLVGSVYALSTPVEQEQVRDIKQEKQIIPVALTNLGIKISEVKTLPSERNQRLRFERAQHYYHSAQKFLADNWQKRAIEDANRGLTLLAMNDL